MAETILSLRSYLSGTVIVHAEIHDEFLSRFFRAVEEAQSIEGGIDVGHERAREITARSHCRWRQPVYSSRRIPVGK